MSAGNSSNADQTLYIAKERRCSENGTIPSGQSKVFKPQSDTNPCGFPFKLGARYAGQQHSSAASPDLSLTDAGTMWHTTGHCVVLAVAS